MLLFLSCCCNCQCCCCVNAAASSVVLLLIRCLCVFAAVDPINNYQFFFPPTPVDLFAVNVTVRRRHFDLRGVLLHVELLSTAPQQNGVVCVTDVILDVNV